MTNDLNFSQDDHYYTSLFESISLEYDIFLSESSAFKTISMLDLEFVHESSCYDIEILNESIKETLTLWITRFTEAIQKALTKFVQIIDGARDAAYLKSIEGSLKNLKQDPGFNINHIREYKDDFFTSFKVKDFMTIYNSNKDSMQSQDQFLIQNYGDYFSDGKTNIKDQLEQKIVQVVTEPVACTKERLETYYNWCRNDYKKDLDTIQSQMNTYNTSIKSISNLVATLPDDYKDSSQTQGNPNVTTASYIFNPGMIISEAEEGNNNDNDNDGKMTFTNTQNYAVQKGGGNQEAVNAVRNYLTCTSKILSSLMIIIKNR